MNTVSVVQPGNPWARISEIAGKLGVAPYTDGGPATILAEGADGKKYDVWEVVSKALDKLEIRVTAPEQDDEKST